ncbi:PP2C family protein-serine/threonine phosphatase [Kitasatospora sp. NPDC096147]|uniref:PP2C family protein-serine/threonine phosphatase n=1 Tax=Kitasatospora sp. NPDC096147 TaxID=3364093 RepID=UPI0037F3252E
MAWSDHLHRLWRVATSAPDVTALTAELFGALGGEPGVLVVAGARWGADRRVRYLRISHPGDAEPRWEYPDGALHAPLPAPVTDGPPVHRSDPGALAAAGRPEAAELAASGAALAVQAVFPLSDGGWGTILLGVADESAADAAADCLAQAADVVACCEQRLSDQHGREELLARDAILAEASLQMGSSLDIGETLQRVARIAVPAVADGCLVHLYRDGAPAAVAQVHVSARRQARLVAIDPADPWLAALLARASRSPGGLLLGEAELAGGPFGPGSEAGPIRALTVDPLRAHGRALGTLTFLYDRDRVPQPAFRADLATRAALAIDNAASYEQRRQDVLSLQRHLLPARLPELPGLELAAAYRVADAMLEVGGDFYDVVAAPEGRTALLIGDVCGRGAPAAALTGLARHTLRTVLEDGTGAGPALTRLNRTLHSAATSRFVTALACVLEPVDGGLLVHAANAGHPPPLVLRTDGTVDEVPARGLLLGVLERSAYEESTVRLAPGDRLVMFTDGLTESRDAGGVFFEQHLKARLAKLRDLPAAELAERLAYEATEFTASGTDDIAVLVAGLTPPPSAPALTPAAGAAPGGTTR